MMSLENEINAMLPIHQEKINFIISVAREYHEGSQAMVNEELAEGHNSDTYTEHSLAEIVNNYKAEDHAQDSAYNELKGAIDTLNEEEQYNLIALMWIGRGTYSADEFEIAVQDARTTNNKYTTGYLIEMPLLPDYLEEGLTQLEDSD